MKAIIYHEINPQVYKAFEQMTLVTIKKGYKKYSAKGIYELVRWTMALKTEKDSFKINNNYTSFYARKFMNDNPAFKGFFELRPSKFD